MDGVEDERKVGERLDGYIISSQYILLSQFPGFSIGHPFSGNSLDNELSIGHGIHPHLLTIMCYDKTLP